MGTIAEHEAEIIAGQDLIDRFTAALAGSKVRTAGNIRDLNLGIRRGRAEIIKANKSIELHNLGFTDTQISIFFKDTGILRLWTGLLLGTCSGCTAGKINLAFDVSTMYLEKYNSLTNMGFVLTNEKGILPPEQVFSINNLGLSEWQKIKSEPETISEPMPQISLDPVPETNIVPVEAGIINDQDVNFENSFIQTELGKAEEIGIDQLSPIDIEPMIETQQEQKSDIKNILLPLAALFIASGG